VADLDPLGRDAVRRHLTIVLSDDAAGEVAGFRHRWDPLMAAGVPPHISLVYPEEYDDTDLLVQRAREQIPRFEAFAMELADVVAEDDGAGGVFVSVVDRAGKWHALRDALLAPPWRRLGIPPHVTVVHPRTSDRGPEAWRSLRGWRSGATVVVDRIAFTATGRTIGMRVVEEFRLGSA